MILTAQVLIFPAASSSASVQAFPMAAFCDGIEYPEEVYAPDAVYDAGEPFITLRFPSLSPAQYVITLARAGLTTAKYAAVTVAVPGDDGLTYVFYNGQAVNLRRVTRLQLQYDNVVILVRQLETF